MTIASAFNELAVAQGGTADNSGTIAGAIDALTDALAGSDIPEGRTIEDNVKILGEHLSGGGASFGAPVMLYNIDNENVVESILFYGTDADSYLVPFTVPDVADVFVASNTYIGLTTDWEICKDIDGTVQAPMQRVNQIELDGTTFNVYKIDPLDSEDDYYQISWS